MRYCTIVLFFSLLLPQGMLANKNFVDVYVLDNGIRKNHVALKGVVGTSVNLTESKRKHGSHATEVAGVIAGRRDGVARGKVVLHSVKILDHYGDGQWSGLLEGLYWVGDHHEEGMPAVLNLSLGGEPPDAIARLIEKWLCKLLDRGIVVVVAAGNDGVDAPTRIPSRLDCVISVGAVTRDRQLWEYSNFGSNADFYALGVDVRVPSNARNSSYIQSSGTSIAAAAVTGLVARFLYDYPNATQRETLNYLKARCVVDEITGLPGQSANRVFLIEDL